MAEDKDETTELDKGFEWRCGTDAELRHAAAVGRTAGIIMAAAVYDKIVPANFVTPALARKCREAALICHGVEDAPGSE